MIQNSICGDYGLDHYRPPLCFELVGKSFTLIMDNGVDYVLNFVSNKFLEWNYEGNEPQVEEYECLKGDDTTYLVSFEISNDEQRTNHTVVLDLENMLVTRIIARNGENPKFKYLNSTYFDFGAILKEDGTTEFKRHSYTDEMVGTCVQWCYGPQITTVHVYYCTNFYRITYPYDNTQEESINEGLMNLLSQLPSSDEPAVYIRIKDKMYLVSITEVNMEKLLGAKGQFRSNTLCFLQNYDRLYQVGRAFGNITIDEGDIKINMMFGAYGKFTDVPEEYIAAPNPYIV